MASDANFVNYVMEQLSDLQGIASKKMFGEYGIYNGSKLVALICDNQLFVKITDGGRKYIGSPIEAPPYPGAKPYFLVQDELEDKVWLGHFITLTTNELPVPKPKKPKSTKPQK